MKLLKGETVPKDDLRAAAGRGKAPTWPRRSTPSRPDSYWLASQIPADRIAEFYK